MLRQPSKPDKTYDVEVRANNGQRLVCKKTVNAQSPADALVFALREDGHDVVRDSISVSNENDVAFSQVAAKVMLIGGRKSISWYSVHPRTRTKM